MFIVYVKHYLTPTGLDYVNSTWYDKVLSKMQKQKGFHSFTKSITGDCAYFEIHFQTEEHFNHWWKEDPDHDSLILDLDPYRSRSYWESTNSHAPNSWDRN